MKSDLNKLQNKIYSYMKKKARPLEGEWSSELKSYQKAQKKLCHKKIFKSDFVELINSVQTSSIIYLGDFHTFDQNIKNLERILRKLTKNGNRAIGIEFVSHIHQTCIDAFMKKELTELEFLECIDYKESWRFPWSHYKTIFDLARKNKFKVIALNSTGSLNERDINAATLINNYFHENPAGKMIVLFGEYHIVKDKLPLEVKKLKPKIKSTIIHQNLDELYIKTKMMKGEIFKFNPHEFALQTSPPWIKYESMIYWFENMAEDPEFDIHQYIMENKIKTFSSNAEDNFLLLARYISSTLNLDVNDEKLEDFNLYDHLKLDFIYKSIDKTKRTRIIQFYNKLINNGKSFKLPLSSIFYCSNYSINRLSFLAGTHIHNLILKEINQDYETVIFKGTQKDKFLFFYFSSMFAYFASKLINPHRKCDLYQDVVARQKAATTHHKKRSNLELVVEIIDNPTALGNIIRTKSLRGMHSGAKTLGNMTADYIFEEFYKQGSPKTTELITKLLTTLPSEDAFLFAHKAILSKKKFKRMKKRVF